MNIYFRAFLAGSSFPVVVLPFLYLGLSFHFNPVVLDMGLIPLVIPILMGVVNTLFIYYKENPSNREYFIVGGLYGLGLSLYGNFVEMVPTELFLLPEGLHLLVVPTAIILYGLIWRYPVKMMNGLLIKN